MGGVAAGISLYATGAPEQAHSTYSRHGLLASCLWVVRQQAFLSMTGNNALGMICIAVNQNFFAPVLIEHFSREALCSGCADLMSRS